MNKLCMILGLVVATTLGVVSFSTSTTLAQDSTAKEKPAEEKKKAKATTYVVKIGGMG